MIFIHDYDPKAEAEFEEKLREYLSTEDYNSFKLAENKNTELWQSYHDQNLITSEKVYEEIFVPEYNDSFSFLSKMKIRVNPGVSAAQLLIHPEYSSWLNTLPTELQPKGVESIIFED
jgi:hypothetical protein